MLFNIQTRFTEGPLNLLTEVAGYMIDFTTDFIYFTLSPFILSTAKK